jgi:hypothetical protein
MSSARLQNYRSIWKKSIVFLYTRNKQSENEGQENNSLKNNSIRKNKYLGINLIREVKNVPWLWGSFGVAERRIRRKQTGLSSDKLAGMA